MLPRCKRQVGAPRAATEVVKQLCGTSASNKRSCLDLFKSTRFWESGSKEEGVDEGIKPEPGNSFEIMMHSPKRYGEDLRPCPSIGHSSIFQKSCLESRIGQ